MAFSLIATGVANFVTFLVSIPLVGVGIWLAIRLNNDCVRFLEWPVIAIGGLIMIVSLAGFFGACYRIPFLLYIYLIVMFFVILLLLVFIIFAFVVTKDGPAGSSSRRSYDLEDYSPWLKKQLRSSGKWSKIVSCIKDANVCRKMNDNYKTLPSFYSADLSPIESGCCNPPQICGYVIAGPTNWNNPSNVNALADCTKWNNNQDVLCYGCDSCRAGVAAKVKGEWRRVLVVSVVVLGVLMIAYIVGCCAFRHAQREDLFHRHGHHGHRHRSHSWRRRHWFRGHAR